MTTSIDYFYLQLNVKFVKEHVFVNLLNECYFQQTRFFVATTFADRYCEVFLYDHIYTMSMGLQIRLPVNLHILMIAAKAF